MYVARADALILHGLDELHEEYERRFGERFIAFNYADFHATEEKHAAEVYKETLEQALRDGKPYHLVSRRYDVFDH